MKFNYALDADIIISFVKLKKMELLLDFYDGDFYLFDTVKKEIGQHDYNVLKEFIPDKIKEITFNTVEHQNEIDEYFLIIKDGAIGKGEAQLMAYCRYHKEKTILLSNNFKDIVNYCKNNNITYYTLCDILKQLYDEKCIDKQEASRIYDFWIQMNRYLPYASFDELLRKHNN